MNKTVVTLNTLLVLAVGTVVSLIILWPREVTTAVSTTPPNEGRMLELINKERTDRGLAPLKRDPYVQLSATLKANHMEENNYFEHFIPGTGYTLDVEMSNAINKSCKDGESSENLVTVPKDSSSESTVQAWMDSKPHREAILDPTYTITGLALSDGGSKSVQHFCAS